MTHESPKTINSNKNHFVEFEMAVKTHKLVLQFGKEKETVEVTIAIDALQVGSMHFITKNDFTNLRREIDILTLQDASLTSKALTMSDKLWEETFPFTKRFVFDVVEDTISMDTLISYIELFFPPNWFTLLK